MGADKQWSPVEALKEASVALPDAQDLALLNSVGISQRTIFRVQDALYLAESVGARADDDVFSALMEARGALDKAWVQAADAVGKQEISIELLEGIDATIHRAHLGYVADVAANSPNANVGELYDNDPRYASALVHLIPNFEYPDWSWKKVGAVGREVVALEAEKVAQVQKGNGSDHARHVSPAEDREQKVTRLTDVVAVIGLKNRATELVESLCRSVGMDVFYAMKEMDPTQRIDSCDDEATISSPFEDLPENVFRLGLMAANPFFEDGTLDCNVTEEREMFGSVLEWFAHRIESSAELPAGWVLLDTPTSPIAATGEILADGKMVVDFGQGKRLLQIPDAYRDVVYSIEKVVPQQETKLAPQLGDQIDLAAKKTELLGAAKGMGLSHVDEGKLAALLTTGDGPERGMCIGKIVGVDAAKGLVFQATGRGDGVVLPLDKLSRPVEVGEMVTITFKDGRGTVVDREQSRDRDRGR